MFGLALQNVLQSHIPQALPAQQAAPSPEPPQRLSKGQLIMGVLADVLAGAQGRPGLFAHQLGQQRQREQEEAQWHNRRRANLEDYAAQQRIQRDFAPPPQPTEFERMLEASGVLRGSPEWEQSMRTAVENRLNPEVTTMLPGGILWTGPRNELSAAIAGMVSNPEPAPTVGTRVPDPRIPRNSNQRGPASQAPGTFRP